MPQKDFLWQSSRRPTAVPISRTSSRGHQPLVYPSSFDAAETPAVVPIEKVALGSGVATKKFPYGPRSLNIETIEQLRRRRRSPANDAWRLLMQESRRVRRSAELGVRSGYEVVSGVDLDFDPDEDGPVDVFKVGSMTICIGGGDWM